MEFLLIMIRCVTHFVKLLRILLKVRLLRMKKEMCFTLLGKILRENNLQKEPEKVLSLAKLKTLEYRLFRKMREKLRGFYANDAEN